MKKAKKGIKGVRKEINKIARISAEISKLGV